jgi:hypothetical protein
MNLTGRCGQAWAWTCAWACDGTSDGESAATSATAISSDRGVIDVGPSMQACMVAVYKVIRRYGKTLCVNPFSSVVQCSASISPAGEM